MKRMVIVILLVLFCVSLLASTAAAFNERAEENGCRGVGCCKNSMYHRQDMSNGPTSCKCMTNPNPGLEHRNENSLPW